MLWVFPLPVCVCTMCVPGVCGFPYHRTIVGATRLLGMPLPWLLSLHPLHLCVHVLSLQPLCSAVASGLRSFTHPHVKAHLFACFPSLLLRVISRESFPVDSHVHGFPQSVQNFGRHHKISDCMLDLINNLSYCVIPFDCSLLISVLRF